MSRIILLNAKLYSLSRAARQLASDAGAEAYWGRGDFAAPHWLAIMLALCKLPESEMVGCKRCAGNHGA